MDCHRTDALAIVGNKNGLYEGGWGNNGACWSSLRAWEPGANWLNQKALEDPPLIVQGSAGTASFVAEDSEPCLLVGQ